MIPTPSTESDLEANILERGYEVAEIDPTRFLLVNSRSKAAMALDAENISGALAEAWNSVKPMEE